MSPTAKLSSSGTYLKSNSFLFLGISADNTKAFQGDLREFYMNAGRLDPEAISALASNFKIFEQSSMAYY
jgi:hypothetical protein